MNDIDSPPDTVPSVAIGFDRLDEARLPDDRLARVHGPDELQAALLAMLLPAGSQRAVRAWQIETGSGPAAELLRDHISRLPAAGRLPWFEVLLHRMASQPLAARRQLLQSARRVMGARGVARPIDRLHWLVMRRRIGEAPRDLARPDAQTDLSQWLESDVHAIAIYSAFLARMVPVGSDDGAAGQTWYRDVMATWSPRGAGPELEVPTAEAMVGALQTLQTLSWMQRPIVVRSWIAGAIKHGPRGRLSDLAADALRLSCAMLDAPEPPELARCFIVLHAMP